MALHLFSDRVLCDGAIRPATIVIDGGFVREVVVDREISSGLAWNVRGRLVLPGIVDLHGDAFERQLMPRPRVGFPVDIALRDTDRQLVSNGITTAFHGVTSSWEPGLRSASTAAQIIQSAVQQRSSLACDTRIHLRFEVRNVDGLARALGWIHQGVIDLVAFNDHFDGTLEKARAGRLDADYGARSGLSDPDYHALLEGLCHSQTQALANVVALARASSQAGLPMASHDDDSANTRERYRYLGCRLCEFPNDLATARAARDGDDTIIMGAPNVVRGGSHTNRLRVRDAVAAGLCDVLVSDYFYPALLYAPFALTREGVLPLAEAWQLVSANAAHAAGLIDRGTIRPGARADLLVIEEDVAGLPRVSATVVAGAARFQAEWPTITAAA